MLFSLILITAKNKGIRIIHLGRKDRIPQFLHKTIEQAEKETATYSNHVLNFAIDYGGQDEILRACQKLLDNKVESRYLTNDVFETMLDTAHQPYPRPDLIVRASPETEYRLSDFMAWQTSFTEFVFIHKFFPDFTKQDIDDAIIEFGRRKRTLGGD